MKTAAMLSMPWLTTVVTLGLLWLVITYSTIKGAYKDALGTINSTIQNTHDCIDANKDLYIIMYVYFHIHTIE